MKNGKIYFYLLLTYIVMHLSSILLMEGIFEYYPWHEKLSEKEILFHSGAWSLFITNFLAAIVFFLLIRKKKKFFSNFAGKKSSIGQAVLWGVLGFFLAMGGQILAATIEGLLGIPAGSENTQVLGEIAKYSPIIILSIVIFAPLLEEIVFRRVIFGGVYEKTNFWIAAIVSGLIFAAVHWEFSHILMYLAPALIFSYIYYRTKRLIAPMISHFLMNGFVTVLQLNIDKLEEFQNKYQVFIHFLLK